MFERSYLFMAVAMHSKEKQCQFRTRKEK